MFVSPEFVAIASTPVSLPELEALHDICPFGTLTLELLLSLNALLTQRIPEYENYMAIFQRHLVRHSFMSWMGTEWPLLGLANNEFFSNFAIQDERISCDPPSAAAAAAGGEGGGEQLVDWRKFKRLMRSGEDWFLASFAFVFDEKLLDVEKAMAECPVGFALVHAIKSMICANTESICFRYHVQFVDRVLGEIPIDILAASDWKIVDFLGHVKSKVVRHGYKLDFTRNELVMRPDDLVLREGEISQSYADFLEVLAHVDRTQPVTMTMVYGPKFTSKLGRFLRRAEILGIDQFVVFALDTEAWDICKNSYYRNFCIRGTPSILNKFTLPLVFLNAGLDVFWLDFDVFLFKNPLPFVTAQAEGLDVMTASSFAADCVCSGLVFLKANEIVKLWWTHTTAWMYRHSFEHDQKTVSAFLNAGERVAAAAELPDIAIPEFGYFEAGTLFVSARHVEVGGWTGSPDDIVIYHFLNGDSDDKASIKNDDQLDFYDDLMEAFYGEAAPTELFRNGQALPHTSSELLNRLLMKSRWDQRPADRPICTGVVPVQRATEVAEL